jgi:hypothetical protein
MQSNKGHDGIFYFYQSGMGCNRDFLIEDIPARREFVVVNKHQVLVLRRELDVATML